MKIHLIKKLYPHEYVESVFVIDYNKLYKKELWNNVIKAMKEYCEEYGHFEITCCECGANMWVDFSSYKTGEVGELIPADEEEWEW